MALEVLVLAVAAFVVLDAMTVISSLSTFDFIICVGVRETFNV